MNIVFLCGALEPGYDGVGDYVRRLAGELIRQGHQAAAVALYDQYSKYIITDTQNIDGTSLPVLRIPLSLSDKDRFSLAKQWIDKMGPTWVSLQFVPFSFHSKGLPFSLSKQLLKLGTQSHWHIMFHELWVGMSKGSSQKHILWGWVQKQLIKSLLSTLQPKVIHTQTRLYQEQLSRLGFNTEYLPLFANIPTIYGQREDATTEKNKENLSLVVFGSIHPGSPIEQLAKEAALYAKKSNVQIKLILVGKCGTEQDYWIVAWKSAGLEVEVLGEQLPERISQVLSNASIGIATTPIILAEKSGSIAAMQAHGLHVICVSNTWISRHSIMINPPCGISEYRQGNFENCIKNRVDFIRTNSVSDIARELMTKLLATSHPEKMILYA